MKKGSHGKRKTRADAIAFLHQCWNCQHHHDHIEKLAVRTFPTNIMAGMFGFSQEKWKMFQSEAGAEKAPDIGAAFKE